MFIVCIHSCCDCMNCIVYNLLFTDTPFPSSFPVDMSVRLLGKSEKRVGRVEIFHGGQWLGLCMDSLGRSEAQAICRSLKYVDGLPIVEISAQVFGLGYSSSWIVELGCSPSEGSAAEGLVACSTIRWSSWSCRSAQPGVLCSGEHCGGKAAAFIEYKHALDCSIHSSTIWDFLISSLKAIIVF